MTRCHFLNVFRLHHKNALYIELSALLLLLLLGFLMEVPFFQIPAAASILLFFAILLAPIGALSYWLKSWAFASFILSGIAINLSVKTEWFNHTSEAYGLRYKGQLPPYNLETISQASNHDTISEDKRQGLEMLNAWKKKVSQNDPSKKPPLFY